MYNYQTGSLRKLYRADILIHIRLEGYISVYLNYKLGRAIQQGGSCLPGTVKAGILLVKRLK